MVLNRTTLTLFILLCAVQVSGQKQTAAGYWNRNTQLTPWRFPLADPASLQRHDTDKDGKPDYIKGWLFPDSVSYIWIDQDNSMTWECNEGNTINGLLAVDRNKDGLFDGHRDLILKWGDRNGNGIPDIMMVIQNGGPKMHHYFDWGADYMIIIDDDEDGILNFVDWNELLLHCWDHDGHANFYTDYHGNTMFLKMHGSSYRMNDLRFNWENPFIFFSEDDDPFSEWTIRLVDEPFFRPSEGSDERFRDLSAELDIKFSGKISDVRMSWDMDNDNRTGSEFDFDMSIKLTGTGFDYSDQVHPFKSLHCNIDKIPAEYWRDTRWSNLTELIFPGRNDAWDMLWGKGNWHQCHFVFDEDDDCHRWERVELYDPRDPFRSGIENGGIDHNKQADVAGDRGNWDMDFSGKGNLYVGPFDGKIHLHGAEWGIWRIDQSAFYYQGFGGNYGRWGRERLQRHADTFATVRYSDSDNNGFFDYLEYDLDGDGQFEHTVSLHELGIQDTSLILKTSEMTYADFNSLFSGLAEKSYYKGMQAVHVAQKFNLNTHWYNFYKKPVTAFQKYQYGFWLGFYIYHDFRQMALDKGDSGLVNLIDKAYFSGNWEILE